MTPLSSAKIRSCALFALSLSLSVLLQTTPASATLIDFETYPGGASTSVFDPIDTQFSAWGISFMESEDLSGSVAEPVIGQWPDYPVAFHSGISALAPHPGAPLNPDPEIDYLYGLAQAPIHIYFSSPLDYFSVYAMDVGYNGLMVNAFDVDSSLIASVAIDGTGRNHDGPPGGDGFDFIELTVPGIVELSFSQIHDSDWDRDHGLGLEGYLLDDISFTFIPEPSTILLVGLGLIGLSGRGRRHPRRKSSAHNPATDRRD